MNFQEYTEHRFDHINKTLLHYLPHAKQYSERLEQAMQYAVLNGGKRLRPLLVYAAGETLGAPLEHLNAAACAVEFIHAYSLIHDDLPALDNDDMRRGKPSCHKAFDEATAILAGDALHALAFEVLAENNYLSVQQRLVMLRMLAQAIGYNGMVGGQTMELELIHRKSNLAELELIHRLKTGALIQVCVQLGAVAANADPAQEKQLKHYGDLLGLAFQIQDDILDHQEDHINPASSYLAYTDLNNAKKRLNELRKQALMIVDKLGNNALPLRFLVEYMIIS